MPDIIRVSNTKINSINKLSPARIFLLVALFLWVSAKGWGQVPTAYAVTGGGSYCQGSGGLPVGLTNSEIGVTYTLIRNNIDLSPTVVGTGSAISFGNNLLGTYTVRGTNLSGSTPMPNSVIIIENPTVFVSVTISPSANNICSGTSVTFTSTPVGGGTIPTYQWYKNSASVATGSIYTYAPVNGDQVYVVMTSNATCATGNPATSNTITMVVNSTVAASVSIGASANPVCSGTSVTFTSTPVGGGTTPTYQWKVNNINAGTNNPVYSYAPANGDAVTCILTSNSTCATGNPATSNTITMVVNSTVAASVSIGASANPVCSGTSVIFTANPVGGGSTPTYQWYKNSASVAIGSIYTYAPVNGDQVYVVMTSNALCATGSPATSTAITMTVYGILTAGISGGSTPICSGSSPGTLTATGGGGTGSYTYQWYTTSGIITGATSSTYNPGNLTTTTGYYCAITSGMCGTVNTSTVTITVTPEPSATITYSGSPWCSSDGVQNVTLVGTHGGTYSAQPTGLTIDISTGAITPATSSANTYTVTYTIAASGGCGITKSSYLVTISPTPTAPVVGAITQPTCSVTTGSVVLSVLPAGPWTLTRNPGSVKTTGSGSTTTISNLLPGSYTFTVTNSVGCVSPASGTVTINPQPASPSAPVQSINCVLGFNHSVVTITSPIGADLQYSLDGGAFQISPIFSSVINGSHYFSVTNAAGCTTFGTNFSVSCGCTNPPVVVFSSSSGNTCGIAAVTVTGNTFGGTATLVTLTSNGAGLLSPSSSIISPFSFTYTPAIADGGKIVTITTTTNNPLGSPCEAGVATYSLTINAIPSAPVVGTITNLTCSVSTGSVALNGLPSSGTWTLIRNPGAIITNGSGPNTIVSGLVSGTFNFIVKSAAGCSSISSLDVVIGPQPSAPTAPVVGTITQPTCAISTGSVVLSGLPGTGVWSLTRTPGGVTISGSGTSATITSIPSGTYTFILTNSTGCFSSPSANVIINIQPPIPDVPLIGTIIPPTCTSSTGGVILAGLPSTGTWTVFRYPGTISTTGTGTTTTITGLPLGTYNFTVTTAEGCLSVPSLNLIIPAQPPVPATPAIGTITQPTLAVPTGSVVLNGLPSSGAWVITRLPGGTTTTGTGISKTITGLPVGVFTFTVTNSVGCTSVESVQVIISTPGVPILTITNPPAVCIPATVDITSSAITTGSTSGLTYTYWKDAGATAVYSTPATTTDGTYYIKGTTVSGYFNIKPVIVTVQQLHVANGGVNQTLEYQFSTTLNATLGNNETGIWSMVSGTGDFYNNKDPRTQVSGLSLGNNILLWTVQSGVCPVVFDTVTIIVHNLIIPTLITPNMDGRNDYFVLRGLAALGKTELVIFDRRGAQVYKNLNYDNSWNGVDYNKNPLPDDTYFYVLKSANGKSVSGYVVIRR